MNWANIKDIAIFFVPIISILTSMIVAAFVKIYNAKNNVKLLTEKLETAIKEAREKEAELKQALVERDKLIMDLRVQLETAKDTLSRYAKKLEAYKENKLTPYMEETEKQTAKYQNENKALNEKLNEVNALIENFKIKEENALHRINDLVAENLKLKTELKDHNNVVESAKKIASLIKEIPLPSSNTSNEANKPILEPLKEETIKPLSTTETVANNASNETIEDLPEPEDASYYEEETAKEEEEKRIVVH
ncbi:hypothetical protein [[Mycoplasma] anseris]|uniref:Uncharacterized protein n=1 Tax=[Mycoplasma] anseris TaxID=92400 RepID=A0A2Z4NDM3_9BACT|nr:hypothetical protein [[Mycoplasma] anseris]AWX69694.1 hypothetical protein DP065_02985 [[Mycoplasma] anseris]